MNIYIYIIQLVYNIYIYIYIYKYIYIFMGSDRSLYQRHNRQKGISFSITDGRNKLPNLFVEVEVVEICSSLLERSYI